jgi:hypothetical protein
VGDHADGDAKGMGMEQFPVRFYFGDAQDSVLEETVPAHDAEALATEIERKLEQGFFRIQTTSGIIGVNGANVRYYIILPARAG